MTEEPNDNIPLIQKAVFGRQVEEFLNTDIGRFMVTRAEQSAESAMEKLKTCDPRDGKIVQSLQNEIWKAESFQEWMAIAIMDGLRAHKLLEDGE